MSFFPSESNFSPSATARAIRQTDDQKPITKTMQTTATQQVAQDFAKPAVPVISPSVRVDPPTNIPVLEIYQAGEVVFRSPTERELRAYRNGEKADAQAAENDTETPEATQEKGGAGGFRNIVAKNQAD